MTSINSSTTSSGVSTALTAKTGIGGLVSGLDIDSLVESMTAISRQKITIQQQAIQKLEWKQTAYRSVTSAFKEFQSKYLDVLSNTNFRSTSFFNTVKSSSSSDSVTVSSTASASTGTMTIDSVTRLATYANVKSAGPVSKPLTGNTSVSDIIADIAGSGLQAGDSISVSLDGRVKTITFDNNFFTGLDANNFASRLQGLTDNAFGAGMVTVSGSGTDPLTLTAPAGSRLVLNSIGTASTTLADLGFQSGQSNLLTLSAGIGNLSLSNTLAAGSDGDYNFTINDVNFDVKSTDSLSSVINKINSSKAGVTISYSSITDRFTMTAAKSGAGNTLVFGDDADGGNFLASLGLNQGAVGAGVNAELSVNGVAITRSSNTFNIDGVDITLNRIPTSPVTITTTGDSTALTDTVKQFVEDYNAMLDLVNGLVQEEAYRDYPPLTDEQKKEMSESEISAWEKKAKSGILKGDPILRSISTKLQTTISAISVNGVSLYTMGISTGSYMDNGKLKIDDAKLKDALESKGGEIRDLFTSANGLGNALYSILNGATKTSGVKGSRGLLVELAGVDNTTSSTENSIYDQIKRTNKNIETLKTRLTSEESRLWKKFSAMESVINNLNSQSSYLSSFSSQK